MNYFKKTLGLLAVLVTLSVGLAYATPFTTVPSNPPADNTWFPVNIGISDQLKLGGLGVVAFNALQSAEFEKDLYLQGTVRANVSADAPSTVVIGGGGPLVDTFVSGKLIAQNDLVSDKLINTINSRVCADAGGRLIQCAYSLPQAILEPSPVSVNSGEASDLKVTATNFDTLTSCTIDQGVGPVTMTAIGGGQYQGHKTKTNITAPTVFHVVCTGVLGGTQQTAIASATVVLKPGSPSGYYAHCFVSNTLVTLADGTKKAIQEIKIGDILKGETTNNVVLGYHQPDLGKDKLYGFNGGDAFVTAEHPFMTTKGWKSINPDKTRQENIGITVTPLGVGDTLVTDKGLVRIKSIESHTAPATTKLYNFILSGDHTYYADDYLVHNKQLCTSTGSGAYPACQEGTCISDAGYPTIGSATGSCSLLCVAGQPTTSGTCLQGGAPTCTAQGEVKCL